MHYSLGMMRWRIVWIVWVTLVAGTAGVCGALAKQEPARDERAYESPRATMRTFLESITAVRDDGRDELWPSVLACFDFAGAGIDPASYEAKRRAVQLLDVLDRIRAVKYEELPDRSALIAAGVQPDEADRDGTAEAGEQGEQGEQGEAGGVGAAWSFTYFPRPFTDDAQRVRELELGSQHITLARGDGFAGWRFSADTVEQLPSLHTQALHLGKLKVRSGDEVSVLQRYMPRSLVVREWLEVMYWQWLSLGVLILVGVVLDHLVRSLLRIVIARKIGQTQSKEHVEAIYTAARPLGMFAAGVLWLLALRVLALPLSAHQLLHAAAAVWTVLSGTWAAWRVTDLVGGVFMERAKKTATKLDDILIPLVRKAMKIFIVAIGIVYGADALNIPIGPMLASLGIGGLAFAFAAKDTIENFFGSVAVILDRPFEVGDWVVIGEYEGTVEELGFRSTRIRTFYNSQITVPNASLVRAAVDNYGRRKYRRWKTTLGVQYDTPPELLLAFTEGIRELVRTHPYTRKDYYQVWCNDYGSSSLDIMLYVFFEVPDWNTELRERERLFVDIVRLADQLDVSFAFPTTTVHLFNEEKPAKGERYQPEHQPPSKSADRRAFVKGIRAAQQLIANQSWRENKPGPHTYTQVGPTTLTGEDLDPADATENTQAVAESDTPDPAGKAADKP